MICTNFQIWIWPTWLKIPKIGSKNPYFQFFHFTPSQNPFFLLHPVCHGLYLVCTNFQPWLWHIGLKIPKIASKNAHFYPIFPRKKITFAQNQYFFGTSCQIWFKYGLYQFLALTLTYRTQNRQNRLKIPKNYFGDFEPCRSKSGLKIGTDHIWTMSDRMRQKK